jgi:hypothetical protein
MLANSTQTTLKVLIKRRKKVKLFACLRVCEKIYIFKIFFKKDRNMMDVV